MSKLHPALALGMIAKMKSVGKVLSWGLLCILLITDSVASPLANVQPDLEHFLEDRLAASDSDSEIHKRSTIPAEYQETCGSWQICDKRTQRCATEVVLECENCRADVCNFGQGGKDIFQNPGKQKDCQNYCPVYWKNNFSCKVCQKECALVPESTLEDIKRLLEKAESENAALHQQNHTYLIWAIVVSVLASVFLVLLLFAAFVIYRTYTAMKPGLNCTSFWSRWKQMLGFQPEPGTPPPEKDNLLTEIGPEAKSTDSSLNNSNLPGQGSGQSSATISRQTSDTSLSHHGHPTDEAASGLPTSTCPNVSLHQTLPHPSGTQTQHKKTVIAKPTEGDPAAGLHGIQQTASPDDGSGGPRGTGGPYTGFPNTVRRDGKHKNMQGEAFIDMGMGNDLNQVAHDAGDSLALQSAHERNPDPCHQDDRSHSNVLNLALGHFPHSSGSNAGLLPNEHQQHEQTRAKVVD